jgi:hypothetical protein
MNKAPTPCTATFAPSDKDVPSRLSSLLKNGIDEAIQSIKDEYLRLDDPTYSDVSGRYEQCLFKLYEAKHFAIRGLPELDTNAYVLDDKYRESVASKLSRLFDSDYAQSEYSLAVELVSKKRFDEASIHFYNAAVHGHTEAQYSYGVSISSGDGGKTDLTEAAFWYFTSAKKGCKNAMISLAIAYSSAMGVILNKYMTAYWYAMAAKHLVPYGAYNLGNVLICEDIVKGHAAAGRQLKLCAERLTGEVFEEYVQEKANLVIELIASHTFNI